MSVLVLSEEDLRRILREELARLALPRASVEDRRVTRTEAAAAAGVSPATLSEWVSAGLVKVYGEGRNKRYSLAEVLAVRPERQRGPSVEERAEAAYRRHHG